MFDFLGRAVMPPRNPCDCGIFRYSPPQPYKCPVCEGRGALPETFYQPDKPPPWSYAPCKSCSGTGIVR